MAKDPVCGMEINESDASGTAEYEGRTYYFCSPVCLKAFHANPAKYAAKRQAG